MIPARANSKRVRGKNLRELAGKPLIQYSIDYALASTEIDNVLVTSDSDEILELAETLGCMAIKRPDELATDLSPTVDAITHALDTLESSGFRCDIVALLQPTVPIRRRTLIGEALRALRDSHADSVISHVEVDYFHPNKMKREVDGFLHDYCEPEIKARSRSDLPKAYYRDGSLYLTTAAHIRRNHSFLGGRCVAVINELSQFVNIDTEKDWKLAEILISENPVL